MASVETIETGRTVNWIGFNEKISRSLQGEYLKQFGHRNQNELSPEVIAFRDALDSFPVPIRVLYIDNGKPAESIHTLIQLDLSRPSSVEAEFLGVVPVNELDLSVLRDRFGIEAESAAELTPATYFDTAGRFITQVLPYAIGDAPDRYSNDLYEFLRSGFWDVIQAKFRKSVDYKAKYGVPSDPILPPSDLLTYRQIVTNVQTGEPPSVEDWQAMVSDIVLIPQVSEHVKRTFRIAKQLFIFSYFEYGFSVASQHYAFLALEAALQTRWTLTLPLPTPVEWGDGNRTEFQRLPMHKDLYKRWKFDRKMLVNGERFPYSTFELLRVLRKKGIITTWQGERIESAIHLRNELSHLEFATVTPAYAATLSVTAELINAMFDSVARES